MLCHHGVRKHSYSRVNTRNTPTRAPRYTSVSRSPAGEVPMQPPWPADRVERWAIDRLLPYARNARTHSPAQVAQIAASMREWGWTNPVLVDETGELIAGHGRIEAAKLLGITEAPVMVARGWTPAQKRAYVLADNQLALNAGWDGKLLAAEVADLQAGEFDVTLLGFSAAQLRGMAGGKTDPDETPPTPEEPISRTGDVWILGEHRLICGDSTKAEDVATLLAGAAPHLMVTDPPYGVEY